jgi:C1A family cysteine protease
MNPASRPIHPRPRGFTCIVFLAVLLICCSAVSAVIVTSPAPTTAQRMAIIKPTTLVPAITTTIPAPAVQTTACDASSQCLYPSEAVATWGDGGYIQTAELPCSYNPGMVAAPQAKYCYRQKVTLVRTLAPVTYATQITPPPYDTVTAPVTTHPVAQLTTYTVQTAATLKPGDVQFNPCPGQEQCNGVCTDTKGSDTNNCGGCGWVCPSGLTCIGGECGYTCPAGTIECQIGQCIDNQNDDNNCGQCGNSCSNRQHCVQGKCSSLCGIDPSHFSSFSWADWKGVNWMTPVKDQAACGSCWAQSSTGAAEALYNIEGQYQYSFGYNLNLSEQALVSGCYGDHGSCTGGNHEEALEVLKTKGVAEDIYMPYQSLACVHEDADGNTVCNANIAGHCSIPGTCTLGNVPANRIWKIASYAKRTQDYAWTDSEEVTAIQKAILCHGPLTACSGNWWHCVDIVGWQGSYWDKNSGWVVRNSWGTGWLSNGYGIVYYGEPLSTDKNKQGLGDLAMDAWSVKGVYHG